MTITAVYESNWPLHTASYVGTHQLPLSSHTSVWDNDLSSGSLSRPKDI